MERRLAAILVGDVVGYSRLIATDEEATIARMSDLHASILPRIEAEGGRVIDTAGDSILAEFGSVLAAVRMAVTVQAQMEGGATSDRPLRVRFGITQGEIVFDGLRVYGDGVNVAARLQALAAPGGVAISGRVHEDVVGKIQLDWTDLGELELKNFPRPVRAFHWSPEGEAGALPPTATVQRPTHSSRRRTTGLVAAALLIAAGAAVGWTNFSRRTVASANQTERPVLAILPFSNVDSDPSRDYLAAGLTDDLAVELARRDGLTVVSPSPRDMPVATPRSSVGDGRQSEADFVLSGSIRRNGDDTRITAQLVDVRSEATLWAQRFDGSWADIFALESDVVDKVAGALNLRLVSGPRMARAPGGTTRPDAYDLYLEWFGMDQSDVNSPKAVDLLTRAVEIDPNYGQAWAGLAFIHFTALGSDNDEKALGLDSAETIARLRVYLDRAAAYPSSPYFQILSSIRLWQRDWDGSIDAAQRAVAADPSDSYSYEQLSFALAHAGRIAEASAELARTKRVDPSPTPFREVLAGLIAFLSGETDDAIKRLSAVESASLASTYHRTFRLGLLAAALGKADRRGEVAGVTAELLAIGGPSSAFGALNVFPFKRAQDEDLLRAGLVAAGLPDMPFGLSWASPNRLRGEQIKALVFGHVLTGQHETGRYERRTTADGEVHTVLGTVFTSKGYSWIDRDLVCTRYDDQINATCATIFSNPGGVADHRDEYMFVAPNDKTLFSATAIPN